MRHTSSCAGRLPSLALVLTLAACGGQAADDGSQRNPGDDAARARAAAYFLPGSQQELDAAWATIEPLVTRPAPAAEDLLRAAIIRYHMPAGSEQAKPLIEQAFALAPDDPGVRFVRGNVLLNMDFEPEAAIVEYQAVLASDPEDAVTHVQLGIAHEYVGDLDTAAEHFEAVRAMGVEQAGGLFSTATYRLGRIGVQRATSDAEEAAAMALLNEREALVAAGIEAPGDQERLASSHGRVRPPPPRTVRPGPPSVSDYGPWTEAGAWDLPGASAVRALDVDGDGTLDLLGAAGARLTARLRPADAAERVVDGPATPLRVVAAGDLDDSDPESAQHHPAPELLLVEGPDAPADGAGTARLYTFDATAGSWFELPLPAPLDGVRAAVFVDYDHDGDLDLVLAGDDGLHTLRNDGAEERRARALTAVTLPGTEDLGPLHGVLAEDLDMDQDVDLLAVGADGVIALSSLRRGRFEDKTAAWGLTGVGAGTRTGWAVSDADGGAPAGGLALVDLDDDGRPDLYVQAGGGTQPEWFPARATGGFEEGRRIHLDARVSPDRVALVDLDQDGALDLLAQWRGREGPEGAERRSGALAWPGPLVARDAKLQHEQLVDEVVDLAPAPPADLSGDGRPQVLFGGPERVRAFGGEGPFGAFVVLDLVGLKDNTHAVGAIVELRAGNLYRRLFADGGPLLVGLGEADTIDVLFITWPNGVIHRELDLAAGTTHELIQVEGLVGSCPFLYTWNGETYTFVSDVLGTTPLGLPMGPGQQVPFDHEEYVKVRGDQLVPRDGLLELAITEELREVTYLDRLRLHAIDHPAEVEVEPHEGFVFPPFPEHHVHTFTDVVAPARIVTGGRVIGGPTDVTELLADVDGRHAQPFVSAPSQYYGLAEPWQLDITLAETDAERAALAAAPRLRLALTGWLRWTDASVNMAAARHPTIAFEPPVLSVPDGDDGWRPAGPPIGFPAGKTKTLVVDVTDLVDRDDPRLRLTTTLALTFDAIRLVRDGDDAPYVDTALEPLGAEVAFRGFSKRLVDPSGELPELFDWDHTETPRWNQHPGRYTRYGDVRPLVDAVDDRFVIFGSGDAVFARFDASQLPPLPEGWTRDWLVYLDGWAKDRDPNTHGAERVTPLPYHGMSSYPPPPAEAAAVDAARGDWDAAWNTRPAARLIPTLAPGVQP